MRLVRFILLIALFSSCLKKDVVVLPQQDYELEFVHGLNRPDIFLDVRKKFVAKTTMDSTWHMKFQNGAGDWAIFLNPMRDISVHKTSLTNIEEIQPSYVVQNELAWHRDIEVQGNVLPAIGTWGDYSFEFPKSFNNVYLLRVKNKQEIVYFKMQILAANNLNYTIQYSALNGDNAYYYVVPKDQRTTHTYLNLRPYPQIVDVEPHKKDWELHFAFGLDSISSNLDEYIYRQYGGLGLFQRLKTNKKTVELCLVDDLPYEDVTYFNVKSRPFSRLEQLHVPFVFYDHNSKTFGLKDQQTLVCRMDDSYVKIAASELSQAQGQSLRLKMKMQNL